MKWWLALALLAGCDPIYDLTVRVRTGDGTSLAGASVAASQCDQPSAELTDATGTADIVGSGFTFPPCDLTVALPGYEPWDGSFAALCGGKVDDCDRVQTLDVVLSPLD